jgi:16S rRNA processing protein RimM
MDKAISVGYTRKPHGLKGEIKLHLEEKYVEDVLNTDIILIEIKGKKTPFFVEDVRIGNNIIAKFEEIDTPEAAMAIAAKALFLREQDILPDDLREMDVDVEPYAHCTGYMLFNDNKNIGIVDSLIEYPQQMMALIKYDNRDVLVPLNTHFVMKLDDAKKEIYLDLPEGILDL